MVEVLVTGGAGFIGSNFVRYALAAHDDWRVTTLDKLTYAGRLENLHDVMDHPRHAFVRADVCDRAAVDPARAAVERRRPLRGRDPRGPVHPGRRGLHPDRRHRHLHAARGGARSRGAAAVRADLDRRGLRQRARRARAGRPTNCGRATRTRPARPARTAWPTATSPPTGCRSSSRARRTTTGRTSSPRRSSRSSSRTRSTGCRCRSTVTAGTCATGCTCSTTAAAWTWSSNAAPMGEVYNIGGGNEVRNVDLTHRILAAARTAALAHHAGRGPPRP